MSAGGPEQTLRDDFALLCAAVREAAGLAQTFREAGARSWDKTPGHPVTEADIAVNELLHARLAMSRPGYGWLSEETSDDGARLSHRRLWVVDPIDGTRAFIREVPEWTVCAALVVDGRPVAGAVANPSTDEVFEAIKGGGARRNGFEMRIGVERPLASSTVLGSATVIQEKAGPMDGTEFRKVHSIAYRMALVASGGADGTVATNALHDWDLAAAEVLVLEAGGAVSDRNGAELRYNSEDAVVAGVVAAGPELHAELVSRLN